MYYFGPGTHTVFTKVQTPIMERCGWCGEHIKQGECGYVTGQPYHEECWTRFVLGSVLHQQRKCSCFGGLRRDEDDGLSLREAAKAAHEYSRANFSVRR